jgi:hypothetical protein
MQKDKEWTYINTKYYNKNESSGTSYILDHDWKW